MLFPLLSPHSVFLWYVSNVSREKWKQNAWSRVLTRFDEVVYGRRLASFGKLSLAFARAKCSLMRNVQSRHLSSALH